MGATIQQSVSIATEHRLRLTDGTFLDEAARLAILGAETPLVSNDQLHTVLLTGIHHVLRIANRSRHRFFGNNTEYTARCSGDSRFGADTLPCRNTDDVQVLFLAHFTEIGIVRWESELFRKFRRGRRANV